MKLLYNNFGKRVMLFLFATLITFPALAQPSKTDDGSIPYAVFDEATSTLYFKWGVPEGTVNTDYYLVNYTTENPRWSWLYQHNPSPVQKNTQKVVFEPAFANARPKKCKSWFWNFQKLTSIEGIEYLNTSECETMRSMFDMCINLERVDVSGFNTKKVTDMQKMFCNCPKLISVTFGKDFSTELVTDPLNTSSMFANNNKLRFVDLFASDHTDAVTTANIMYMFGSMPYNNTKVVYLPHGKKDITNRMNFVYSYNGDETDLRCPQYYSEDKVDIEFPYDFRTNLAQYKRYTTNNKGTIILPYAFTSNAKVRAYTLNKEYDNFMWFESTETVPAHTPFVFRKLSNSTLVDFEQQDDSNNFGITVYATRDTELHPDGPYTASANLSGWTMKGYYVNQSVDSYSNLYYVQNDHFTRANGETLQFAPHRVTFHGAWAISPSGSPAGAPSYEIKFIDNNTTAIEGIETEDTAETQAIFDTAGRKLSALKKGVNIIRLNNGTTKKVIIK